MAKNSPNNSFVDDVPMDLLEKHAVSVPILNGPTLREADAVGTLTTVKLAGRIFLITANHVFRNWADKGPLVAPILEAEVDSEIGPEKWVTINLKQFEWLTTKHGVTAEDPDGYYDIRVALLPEEDNDKVNQDIILPIAPVSKINGPFSAVLTGYPEKKNTGEQIRKRTPRPWAKSYWYELHSSDTPTGKDRLQFKWSHKNGNFMFENYVSDEKAEFKPCGSAAQPYGTSGGPLILLQSSNSTDVPQYSVIGYGMEYDESGKTITAGPSDAIIDLARHLLLAEKGSNEITPTTDNQNLLKEQDYPDFL